MFKLVVILVVSAVACSAAPGLLHSAIVPLATSHSSRIDVHTKPIVTYVAPTLVHAPIVKTVLPAVSHSSHVSLHSALPVVGYGHAYGHGYGHGYGLGYAGYGYAPYGYGHLW